MLDVWTVALGVPSYIWFAISSRMDVISLMTHDTCPCMYVCMYVHMCPKPHLN
jgi:hypothetical protein